MVAAAARQALALAMVAALLSAAHPEGGAGCTSSAHDYCIVGAGPAGIQLGHFLQQAHRDYVILERGARAGTFFQKFPIHRQLNSINRRQTRMMPGEDPEFDLRHDHNSLLGEHVPRVPRMTDEYWVPADTVVSYLGAFSKPQEQAGRIRYCHEVQEVRSLSGGSATESCGTDAGGGEAAKTPAPRFSLTVTAAVPCGDELNDAVLRTRFSSNESLRGSPLPAASTSSSTFCCRVLVMAHGMSVPNVPTDWIAGLAQQSVDYADLDQVLPEGSSGAQGKSVLVLGAGNAAYETVDNLRNWASDLQIGARRVADSLARDTKYVGGIRGRRSTILDAFHLKSYEGITRLADDGGYEDQPAVVEAARERNITRYALVPCGRGRARGADIGEPPPLAAEQQSPGWSEHEAGAATCIVERDLRDGEVILGAWDSANRLMKRAAKLIPGFRRKASPPKYLQRWYAELGVAAPTIATAPLQSLVGNNSTSALRLLLPALLEATDGVTALASPGDMRKPWDLIIRHLGWRMDLGPLRRGGLDVEMMDVKEARVYTDGRGAYKVEKTQAVKAGEPLSSSRPSRYSGQYPRLDSRYQSSSVPHLFFAGAASHGSDRYRYGSPGGFIHGYRFTVKALWRVLELTYHGDSDCASGDSASGGGGGGGGGSGGGGGGGGGFGSDGGWAGDGLTAFDWRFRYSREASRLGYRRLVAARHLWGKLLGRLNSNAALYSMHGGSLCDVIVFDRAGGKARYYEELPEDLVHSRFAGRPRLVAMFAFGPAQFFPPWGAVAASATPSAPTAIDKSYSPFVSVFHPVLEFFAGVGSNGTDEHGGGARPPVHDPQWFSRNEGDDQGRHPPVARWSAGRGSSRYHLQGDRHLDFTTRNHLPGLERFLLAAEEAAWRGRPIDKRFDEVLDVRWDRRVAEQLGPTMPSFVGINAAEAPTAEHMEYWKARGIEADERGEPDNARAFFEEGLALAGVPPAGRKAKVGGKQQRPKVAKAKGPGGEVLRHLAAHLHFMLGVLDVKARAVDGAVAQFASCLRLNPGHLDAKRNHELLTARLHGAKQS